MCKSESLSGIGDLARDVAGDPDWLSQKGRAGRRARLGECGAAIPAAIEMFEDAWVRYEACRVALGEA